MRQENGIYVKEVWGVRGPHNILDLVVGFIDENAFSPLLGYANTKIKM